MSHNHCQKLLLYHFQHRVKSSQVIELQLHFRSHCYLPSAATFSLRPSQPFRAFILSFLPWKKQTFFLEFHERNPKRWLMWYINHQPSSNLAFAVLQSVSLEKLPASDGGGGSRDAMAYFYGPNCRCRSFKRARKKIESDNLSLDSCCLDKPFKLDLIWKKSWRENEKKLTWETAGINQDKWKFMLREEK